MLISQKTICQEKVKNGMKSIKQAFQVIGNLESLSWSAKKLYERSC